MKERNDMDDTSSDESNTVFIDTNLDTRLIIPVSYSDTVLHLKEKIIHEHSESFPELGKIKIKALKRKCKGLFYHMSNSMLVKNAFKGSTKCWFLSVDVSNVKQPNENEISNKPEASNQQALIHFTKTTSGDSSNHRANNSSNKIFDNCGPANSFKEAQKELDVEVKNVTADICSRVCSDFNGEVDYKSKSQVQLSERHVVLGTNTKHKEGDSRVGVNDDHCANSPEGSIRNESGGNKKLKSKKKDKTAVSIFTEKGENVGIDEHSSGKMVAEISKDTEMKNMDDCKSKTKTEDSVLNCTSKNDGMNIDKHSSPNTIEEVPTNVEMLNTNTVNAPVEDASNSIPASREKKRKRKKQANSPHEDNNRIPMRNGIVSKSSVFVEENNTAASTEKLITETPKDVDLVADTSNKKNRKKKKINEEVVVEPPSSHNARKKRFKEEVISVVMNVDKENAENIANDTDKASDVQLAVPCSAIGVDVIEHDVEPVKVKSVAPKLGPENGSKGSKKSKKHNFTNLNENFPPVLNKLGNVKGNVVLSSVEDLVRDNDNIKISSPDKRKEQRELSDNRSTRNVVLEKCEQTVQGELEGQPKIAVTSTNLVETSINREAGKSADNKRLKKKAKKPVSTVAVSSSNYSASEISTIAPHHLNKPTQLDTLLVKASDGSDNIFSKGEEENLETEEFAQKNYGKKERNSRAKEKETKLDFAQGKITPKSTGVSTAKPRKDMGRIEKENQENEVDVQQINYEESERDSLVKEKENKMDISQENAAYITPKGTVEPVANVVEKLKNSDTVKSKKNSKLLLENGSERQSHPKSSDVEHQAAKMLNVKTREVLQRKVNPGNNRPSVSKSSCKKMGEIVNGREKSLLATPASIFRDQSCESSEISDSSTKAPSDNSSSSSDSEEEGADSARGVDYGRSKNEPKTPLSQRLDMDMILRRSSRYKKAKLSAVLPHPEDIESQNVDFVPDSQPNH